MQQECELSGILTDPTQPENKTGRLCKTGVATRICFSDYPKQPFSCAWQNQITFQLLKGDLLCKSCFFFFSSGLLLPKIRRVQWAGLQCKWTINLLNSTFQTAWWTTPSHCDVPTADPASDWWQGTWAGKENTQLSGMVIWVGKELFFSPSHKCRVRGWPKATWSSYLC